MCCGCGSKNPMMFWLHKITKILITLAAINIGLSAANYFDFFTTSFMLQNPTAALYLKYAIGISGVICLVMCAMHSFMCKSCSPSNMNR